jgi:hypothetical protein
VLTVIQIAAQAYGELGLTAPSQVAGGNNSDGVQILALLNRIGNELARNEQPLPALRGEWLLTLIPGQAQYNLPTDLLYLRSDTGWDRSTHWPLAGPMSDRTWQAIKSGIVTTTLYLRYRMLGTSILIDPTPTSADTLAFEYVSKNWCTKADGTPQASFTADTDLPIIDDDLMVLGLKWRTLSARGFNYAEEKAEYVAAVDRNIAQAQDPATLDMGQRAATFGGIGFPQIPDGNFPAS